MLTDPLFFAAIAALTIVIYVLADGFDLGVGIIFLVAPREADRDVMMAGLEPFWDGNETWLVMGGTLLWAAFPAAYYVFLPGLYLPVIAMLLSLVLRGVAFGNRANATRFRFVWDCVFSAGSILAAFCQGLILGGVIGGVPLQDGMFAGGPFGFLSPLGLLCGVGLVGGYALLGAGWLIWRTEGATQVFAREIAHAALLLTAAMMVAVSGWTALMEPAIAARWFAWPNIAWLAPVPVVTALVFLAAWRSLWAGHERRPFLLGIAIFLLGFGGLIVSLWPYVIPRSVTIWAAASDPQSLRFIGVGLLLVLPVVLAYQAHTYWVFRGKTVVEHGY